jgi:hypothetical protein
MVERRCDAGCAERCGGSPVNRQAARLVQTLHFDPACAATVAVSRPFEPIRQTGDARSLPGRHGIRRARRAPIR